MSTWIEVISEGLRNCKVYEHLIKRMAKQIVRLIDKEGLTLYAIQKGLLLCGVDHDDITWMAEKVYQACLEEYRKGKLR